MMAELDEKEMDAVREVGNVGVGNAATALSKMISKTVDINIPETSFVPIKNFAEIAGGRETIVNCIYVNITGDLGGEALLFFKEESTKRFVDLLLGKQPGETKELGEIEISSFSEMANIVVGSYLNSMADMLQLKIMPNPPQTAYDMLQSVIDSILINLSKSADEILYLKTNIKIEEENIEGSMIILFQEESLKRLLTKLKELYGTLT